MDRVSSIVRSRMMSGIHGKDTKPEMAIRRALHRLGFRYQLHRRDLPGTPDMVFPKYKTVLFVNGCFWHRHGCKFTTTPKSNPDFWLKKFSENIERDQQSQKALQYLGWSSIILWECEIEANLESCIALCLRSFSFKR